jgi:hypothetical protein
MGLETGTYIDSLNSSNPTAGDAVSEGDDHLRLIKSTVKATFPNLSGAVTSTQAELNLLDGVTANTTELNYVDITTLGTTEASKAVTADANKDVTGIRNLTITGALSAGSGLVTMSDIYPVGSIYINAAVTTNPATLLGFGTWSAFGTGRCLVGYSHTDSDFDALQEIGGAKTHTLSIAEMPSHNHNRPLGWKPAPNSTDVDITGGNGINPQTNMVTDNTGGGGAHNNMPPYIVVKMWRRTA